MMLDKIKYDDAEETNEDVEIALDEGEGRRQARAASAQQRQHEELNREPGRTPSSPKEPPSRLKVRCVSPSEPASSQGV